MSDEVAALARLTGHSPDNAPLFTEALTHGSHSGGGRDYQRLEFLGDRVLGLIIAQALLQSFPKESEGQLSSRLNALVSRERCAEVARAIGLAPLIRLGKQALGDGARDSDNVLGDVLEAVIGALFLDGGLGVARQFVLESWGQRLEGAPSAPKHPKSALLEWSAANRKRPPEYIVERRDGPDHAPQFTVRASVPHAGEAVAKGSSKQEAETAAAAALLAQLKETMP